jgi:hypothetical protein
MCKKSRQWYVHVLGGSEGVLELRLGGLAELAGDSGSGVEDLES